MEALDMKIRKDRNASRGPARVGLAVMSMTIGLAVGCQSASHRHALTTENAEMGPLPSLQSKASPQGETGVVKSDFRRELRPEQQVGLHLDLARMLEAQGNGEAAVAEYQKAIAAIERGGVLQGKVPTAQKALAHRHMAAAYDRMGRFEQSETHYRQALRLSPNDPKVWNDAGYSAYLQRDYPEAERRLTTAARMAPGDARVHTNLGLALAASGRTDAALEALSRVGGPAIGHANLAFILAAAGLPGEAREHYQAALKIQPDLKVAEVALAKLDAQAPAAGPNTRALASTGTGSGTAAPDANVARAAAGTATR
jgi:tetratricopeptide (TPR) repeat protein